MVERTHTADAEGAGFWPGLLDPLRHAGQRIAEFFAPSAEASGSKEAYEINVELPGVKLEDVSVEFHGNNLVVKGEKHYEQEDAGKTYYFCERRFGSFHRSFRLPEDIVAEDISARFVDGVLCIRIARANPRRAGTQRIEVVGK